jgi:hypothetical protein
VATKLVTCWDMKTIEDLSKYLECIQHDMKLIVFLEFIISYFK